MDRDDDIFAVNFNEANRDYLLETGAGNEDGRRGIWRPADRRPKGWKFRCSECGGAVWYPQNGQGQKACGYPRCPHCGMMMKV